MTDTERETMIKTETLLGLHHEVDIGQLTYVTEGYDKGLYRRQDARKHSGNYWRKLTDPLKLKDVGILSKEEAYKRCREKNRGVDIGEKYSEHREKKW